MTVFDDGLHWNTDGRPELLLHQGCSIPARGTAVPRRGLPLQTERTMAIKNLIWSRRQDLPARRGEEFTPFTTLHREVNRLFDDVMRRFDSPFGSDRFFDRTTGWPNIEVSETDVEVKVTAELSGLDEKDVEVELTEGVLVIKGEKRTETDDKDRRFSERYYGHFERRIPVDDVDEDKVSATFRNGLLTVTMPRTPAAKSKARRIAIGS
jgi:HSP20 family protein